MNINNLLPHAFKPIGWCLFIPGVLLGLLYLIMGTPDPDLLDLKVFALFQDEFPNGSSSFSLVINNVLDEIISLLLILGGLCIAFSREKFEDEFIYKIRLESLVWATYVNYGILLLAVLFVYGMGFFWTMVFNMFTLLVFFIIRFHWAMYRYRNQIPDEE